MASEISRPGLLQRLKAETSTQHESLERSLNLLRPELSLSDYCDLLMRFAAIQSAWERCAAPLLIPVFPEWERERSRVSLVQQDLDRLGRTVPTRWLDVPGIQDTPAAVGAMYVVEGSTLGGQLLTRHFERHFGLTPDTGTAFFNGYGSRTGAMWRRFADAAEEYANRTGTEEEIISGARTMFSFMHRELCERNPS